MAKHCREEGIAIWAYCLMPNHIHLIAVPETEQALRRAIGEAHRRYTRRINFREKWRGFLDSAIPENQLDQLRDHERTGRPLGDATFLQRLEELIGRILLPKKPGRKLKFPK